MPRPSSLTQTEEALLKARLAEYRSTPAAQKDAFRDACARYILRSRQLDEANELLLELFSAKVRNWFQNNTPTETKHVRLPLRINQSFHPLRIFGHKNRDLVRETLAKENAAAPSDTRAYIVQWNETVRRLWDKLSEEEQRPYVRLAELWSVQGPDDDLKPWMAERRSGSWFRAVAHMLWVQCGMPVFIYGMFKDTNGKLRATVYDTTELWAESQPSTPLFRSIKDWDHDFRRTIWTFLQAILDPTQASRDTLEFVQAIRRQPPAAVTFERYSDGTPIMPKEPEGSEKKGRLTSRRQQILREYLRIHYSHATGREAKSVPWQSIREAPEKFFDPGMLPAGFNMQDPSKITDDELNTFFTHVSKMEQRSDGEPSRFRFSSYETGPKGNRSYHPAVYSGSVEAAEPRRPKKSIRVPGFEGPPSDGESEGTRLSLPPPMKAAGVNVPPGSCMHIALDADFAKVTAALAAASVNSGASTPEPAEPGKRGGNPAGGSKGKQREVQPWVEAQVDAAGAATTGWSEGDDELLDDLWVPPRSIDDDVPNDLSFASDDEVEDVLDFSNAGLAADGPAFDTLLDDAIRDLSGTSSSVPPGPLLPPAPLGTLPEVSAVPPSPLNAKSSATRLVRRPSRALASPVAPEAVERDGERRLAYIRQLADDIPYQDLIRLMEAEIREVVTIRGKAPVMWGTWGLKSAHVPKMIQESEKNVNSLLNWIKKGIPQASGPADIQRYCLVAGLILSDLDFIEDTTGVDQWPEDLPGFLVYSELDGEHRDLVLRACEDIVTARKCSDADVTRTAPLASGSIPKAARTRSQKAAQPVDVTPGVDRNAQGGSRVPTRSTRSSTRRN